MSLAGSARTDHGSNQSARFTPIFHSRGEDSPNRRSMSVDQAIKWTIILTVVGIDLILLAIFPLHPRWTDLLAPALCGILLAGLSLHYHRRGGDSLVLCMVSLLHVGCYSSAISLMIYGFGMVALPLADPWLVLSDAWLGFSPPRLVAWFDAHRVLDHWLTWAYLFIVPQTALMILAVSMAGRRIRLEQFIFQFMLGTFVCAWFFLFIPAGGPVVGYGLTPAEWQEPYLDHLRGLRSGEPFLFTWQGTEGLVTFPSFHTAWAIMLMIAWWDSRLFRYPMLFLNALIIVSTVTTGSHYLIDLGGGAALAWACARASAWVTSVSYQADGSPRRIAALTWDPPTGVAPLDSVISTAATSRHRT